MLGSGLGTVLIWLGDIAMGHFAQHLGLLFSGRYISLIAHAYDIHLHCMIGLKQAVLE